MSFTNVCISYLSACFKSYLVSGYIGSVICTRQVNMLGEALGQTSLLVSLVANHVIILLQLP